MKTESVILWKHIAFTLAGVGIIAAAGGWHVCLVALGATIILGRMLKTFGTSVIASTLVIVEEMDRRPLLADLVARVERRRAQKERQRGERPPKPATHEEYTAATGLPVVDHPSHLAECEACRAVAARVQSAAPSPTTEPNSDPVDRWPPPRPSGDAEDRYLPREYERDPEADFPMDSPPPAEGQGVGAGEGREILTLLKGRTKGA